MSELGETPGNKTVRLGIERRIIDYHKAGDMTHVDMGYKWDGHTNEEKYKRLHDYFKDVKTWHTPQNKKK